MASEVMLAPTPTNATSIWEMDDVRDMVRSATVTTIYVSRVLSMQSYSYTASCRTVFFDLSQFMLRKKFSIRLMECASFIRGYETVAHFYLTDEDSLCA